MMRVAMVLLLMVSTAGCRGCARPEDGLEPNNTAATATPLTHGVSVTGRAVQGNVDMFAFAVPRPGVILFHMESRRPGRDEACASFTVTGPGGRVHFTESHHLCPLREAGTTTHTSGVTLTVTQNDRHRNVGYELRVPVSVSGTTYLKVLEHGQADNIFTFSWDYQITDTLIANPGPAAP